MAKQSILTLSAIQTVLGKAIRDLKNGGKRETRNVIELCRSFTKRPLQNDFLNMVKNFTSFSGSQYDPLLHRIAASVREDSLKTLAINLGYTAFAGGADRIRSNYKNGIDYCWLQRLDFSSLHENEISMWNERGVYVFLVDFGKEKGSSETIFSLAAHNTRSTFVLLLKDVHPDSDWMIRSSQYDNLCFLLAPDVLNEVGSLLVENKVLFGVLRNYLDIEDVQTEKEKIMHWIDLGCAIDAYYLPENSSACSKIEDYYQKLLQVRKKGAVEILMCDLQKDANLVQEIILGKRSFPEYKTSV